MARPPDPEKRRELARRGAEVLAAHGLTLPAARLASELGIKRPTLLYHFPTYGHLVEAALLEVFAEQIAFVVARVAEVDHPIDRLDAHLRAVHAFHAGKETRIVFLTQALAALGGPRTEAILRAAEDFGAAHRRRMVADLRTGIAEGTVAPCDPEALVSVVRALTDGLMVQRVIGGAALAPAHELVWRHVLLPLRLTAPATAPKSRRARPADRPARRGRA